jgi:HAD superfamily hydrolase (TIGR01509 family)
MNFFVFDLDGTLIDSERVHYDALIKAGWRPGTSFEEYTFLLDTKGILYPDDETRKRKKENMAYENVTLIKGAEQAINHVYLNKLEHAVVTNSSRSVVEKFCEQLPILKKLTNWVTREDYNLPKPDPECYLLAMEKFNTSGKHVVGFENTLLGAKALRAITDDIVFVRDSVPLFHFM